MPNQVFGVIHDCLLQFFIAQFAGISPVLLAVLHQADNRLNAGFRGTIQYAVDRWARQRDGSGDGRNRFAIRVQRLRHTCGAWLAMTGTHPKVMQQAMRHQSIGLTMDTYGHLFPGQEADAVDGLQDLLAGPSEALAATGTDDVTPEPPGGAQRQAQRADRETRRTAATPCDETDNPPRNTAPPNPLQIAKIDDTLPPVASPCGATASLAQLAEQLTLNQ